MLLGGVNGGGPLPGSGLSNCGLSLPSGTIGKSNPRIFMRRRSSFPYAVPSTSSRAVSTLISTQGIGDLYQLYMVCQRDHIDYNVTYIPETFTAKISEAFDRAYMNQLYQVGRQQMLSGKAWSKYPPGYNPTPFSQIKTMIPS